MKDEDIKNHVVSLVKLGNKNGVVVAPEKFAIASKLNELIHVVNYMKAKLNVLQHDVSNMVETPAKAAVQSNIDELDTVAENLSEALEDSVEDAPIEEKTSNDISGTDLIADALTTKKDAPKKAAPKKTTAKKAAAKKTTSPTRTKR